MTSIESDIEEVIDPETIPDPESVFGDEAYESDSEAIEAYEPENEAIEAYEPENEPAGTFEPDTDAVEANGLQSGSHEADRAEFDIRGEDEQAAAEPDGDEPSGDGRLDRRAPAGADPTEDLLAADQPGVGTHDVDGAYRVDQGPGTEVSAQALLGQAGSAGSAATVTAMAPEPTGEVSGTVRKPTVRERRAAKRLRARKVRRLIRHIDPWTVLKVSFLFYICVFTIFSIAGVLLWRTAVEAGTIEGVEDFIEDLFAFETFAFDPDQIFRGAVIGGAVLVLTFTAITVLLAVLFNLISDLVGGIRLTVIEEETARPRRPIRSP